MVPDKDQGFDVSIEPKLGAYWAWAAAAPSATNPADTQILLIKIPIVLLDAYASSEHCS
jgi:hypothetical protein